MSLSADISSHLGTLNVGLREVRIAAEARAGLPELLATLPCSDTVAVLVDDRVYRTATGDDIKSSLVAMIETGRRIRKVLLEGEVHADEETVAAATRGCAGADVVVTIGSGTLCDIGKVAAGDSPHVVVQTAASVNGFADDQSVLLINGAKRTTHSAWPHALLIDENVLVGAPAELNRSGLGDMISMFTAPADWYLSSLFDMDRGFDLDAAVMTRRYGDQLLGVARGVGKSHAASVSTLAEFVTLSGISMGVAGQTSPSSGMEHTVSHMLDMSNGARGRANAHHGEQVGVATILVALLWQRMSSRIAKGDIGTLALPDPDTAERAVRAAFGWMDPKGVTADECWADYSKKLEHLSIGSAPDQLTKAMAEWPKHQESLDTMLLEPERIVAALREAEAPVRFRDLSRPIDAEQVTWALTNCHLMRNRFTIADLAFLTGHWGPDDVAEVIAAAEDLGAGL
jgi:glycerol-1-phosphate dehydrogenase [NAD(P)+]